MKSNFSSTAFRYFVSGAFFKVIILFILLNPVLAQINNNSVNKPKAILIAELTGEAEEARNRVMTSPIRISGRTRKAYKSGSSVVVLLPQTKSDASRAIDKFSRRFATLKPTPLEEQAFALVNEERLQQHLQPLRWDSEMLYLARKHSEEMARLNFFSHIGRDGKMADDRANDIGVTDWRQIGENIAFNQGVKNNVEIALQSWTNSLRHKVNLLGKKWTRSGIGIAQTPEGKFYITQVFRD